MKRILFQGDSITDVGRHRELDAFMGAGYAAMVSGKLGFDMPGCYKFLNRGISGNRVCDLLARVKKDMINLRPDVISILIGVNDVWHEIQGENGVSAELFEKLYSIMIEELMTALPDLRIMIMEPFVLEGNATASAWDKFYSEVSLRAEASRRIAERYGLDFIPLQNRFNEVCMLAPASYWLYDGVHPSSAGHNLIANAWLEVFHSKSE